MQTFMSESAEPFYLQGRYAQLLRGEISVEDLDDEEVSRGQLRNKAGTFSGRPPKVVPAELVNAMRKEWMERANAKFRQALHSVAIDGMVELAENELVDPAVRLRAMDMIVQRTMGKVPDKITFVAEDPVETLFRAILNDPNGLAPAMHEPSAEERALLG